MTTASDGCADQFDIAMMRREIEEGNERFLAAMLLVAEHVPTDRTTRHHLGLMVQVLVPSLRAARQRIAEVEGEVKTWRWLHWDQHDRAWACQCGDAIGPAINVCPKCGTARPAKRADRPAPTTEGTA